MRNFVRYLSIDSALFESSVYLTSAGRCMIPPNADYPPEGHPDLYQFNWQNGRVLPEFSLLLIEQGSGEWETRKGTFPIKAGEVGMVFPGQWHRYRPHIATGWTENWVQFNGRLPHELEEAGILSASRPVVASRHPHRFARQLQEFLRDVAAPDFVNTLSTGLRLAGLLGFLEKPTSFSSLPDLGLVEKARRHIWNHSHRQLSVVEVAENLGVSRRTLERAFTLDNRSGVLQEITDCRMNRAERLLRETRLSVQQIAGLAGFGSVEQMRLHFQARHDCSPSQFRNKTESKPRQKEAQIW